MQLKQTLRQNELVIKINQLSGDHRVETLISTLDEIASHIQTALVAIEKTENL